MPVRIKDWAPLSPSSSSLLAFQAFGVLHCPFIYSPIHQHLVTGCLLCVLAQLLKLTVGGLVSQLDWKLLDSIGCLLHLNVTRESSSVLKLFGKH